MKTENASFYYFHTRINFLPVRIRRRNPVHFDEWCTIFSSYLAYAGTYSTTPVF